ncbi:MAG: hypothetical protein ACFFDW_14605 [Candidatus Thorarchaeota archaeon]
MEIKSYICYNPKSEIEVDFNKWLQSQYNAMNLVIKYITEFKPDFVEKYIEYLSNKLEDAINSIERKDGYYDFPVEMKFDFLEKYPKLMDLTATFILVHVNPLKISQKNPEKYLMYSLDFVKAFERISYLRVKTFIELLDKDEGLKLYTKILTRIVEDDNKINPQKDDVSITKNRELSIKQWCRIGLGDFTYCILDEHIDLYRFDKCLTHEALKDFNDPDVAYWASCYRGDIPTFNNDKIIQMRRTQTLHHGDFCDEMYWDSRIHNNPKQPSLDFTRKLKEK